MWLWGSLDLGLWGLEVEVLQFQTPSIENQVMSHDTIVRTKEMIQTRVLKKFPF